MNIKLRARLTAYSKIETTTDTEPSIPDDTPESSGGIQGVNSSGDYTIYPSVTRDDIDSLFNYSDTDVDTLFLDDSELDASTINRKEIDSLFNQ